MVFIIFTNHISKFFFIKSYMHLFLVNNYYQYIFLFEFIVFKCKVIVYIVLIIYFLNLNKQLYCDFREDVYIFSEYLKLFKIILFYLL